MSLQERADVIFNAWHLCARIDDPSAISEETVHKVWKQCGLPVPVVEREYANVVIT